MSCRIVPKPPGNEGDAGAVRLKVAWRYIDDQALDFALPAGLQLRGHHFDMGSADESRLCIELVKRALDKAHEVAAENECVFGWRKHHWGIPSSSKGDVVAQ